MKATFVAEPTFATVFVMHGNVTLSSEVITSFMTAFLHRRLIISTGLKEFNFQRLLKNLKHISEVFLQYQLATSQITRWVRSTLLSFCCPLLFLSSSAVNKIDNFSLFIRECQGSNSGRLGMKRERYHCAMPSPLIFQSFKSTCGNYVQKVFYCIKD